MSSNLPNHEHFLSPGQRRLVGWSLSLLATVISLGLLVGLFMVLGELLKQFSGVLWPLAVAGIMGLMLRPLVEIVEQRLRLRRVSAVCVLYALFVIVVLGLLLVITPALVRQILDFIEFVPQFWTRSVDYVRTHYPEWIKLAQRGLENDLIKSMLDGVIESGKSLAKQALPTLRSAGQGALSIFGFAAHLAVVPIYLFFFLLSRTEPSLDLDRQLIFLRRPLREDLVFLLREFIAIVVAFFRGQLLIGIIMGVLLALGFTLIGLRFGLFIGLLLGVLNIVPYLGTIIGLSVALPLALLQPEGNMSLVGAVLVVFFAVQMIEGWLLTPKIMGDSTGLHPVVIIVAIFFWGTALNGILGMVLAIPLTAFFVTAWRLAKRKYLNACDEPA